MTTKPARTITITLLSAVLLLSACSDTISDEAAESVSERCVDVSQDTLDIIAAGLTIENGSLREGSGVKSDYGPDLWIVAAELDGVGFEGDGQYGTWAVVTGLEPDQVDRIAAVDDFTREASTWGDNLGEPISSLIDGVAAAGGCVILAQEGSTS